MRSCSDSFPLRWLVAVALLFFSGACATVPHPPPGAGKSTLWRIKSPTNTVYLMGSIHVLPKSVYPLKPALREAFADSRRVVFEIALDRQKQAMAESFQVGFYPNGEKLSQHLSPETLSQLLAILPNFGIPLEKLEPMRPWMVCDLLMSLYLARQGYQSDLGLDLHFFSLAQKWGKPTSGLETARAQSKPFRQFSDVEADKYLRETLGAFPFTGAWFRQMVRAWQSGDIKTLDDMINRSSQNEHAFYKSIFDDRNNAWMPAIRKFIGSRENVLVIVGSGHLVGNNGLVEQLRHEGFVVEQL